MAEQFLKGYAIDIEALYGVVGGNDVELARRALDHELADEVGELVEEAGLELKAIVGEIVAGQLQTEHAYGYRRVLELVAAVVGEPLDSWEAVMPGRGWQELGPAWTRWGQEALGAIWGGAASGNSALSWPWRSGDHSARWPIAIVVPRDATTKVLEELKRFEAAAVVERGVPGSIDRFSDPEDWPLADLADEIEQVVEVLRAFLGEAIAGATDLLLWHDGQQ
jgi:hypothetical protein